MVIKMRVHHLIATIIFIIFFPLITYATEDIPAKFDIGKANREFDAINVKLANQNLKIENLKLAVDRIDELRLEANKCIDYNVGVIKHINELQVAYRQTHPDLNNENSVDFKFLENKKLDSSNTLAECRLFILRTDEPIKALKITLGKLTANKKFAFHTPIWQTFNINYLQVFNSIDLSKAYQHLGLDKITHSILIFYVIASLLSLVLTYGMSRSRVFKKCKLGKGKTYMLLTLGLASIVTALFFYQQTPLPTLLFVLLIWVLYFIYAIFIQIFFSQSIIKRPRQYLCCCGTLGLIMAIGFTSYLIFKNQIENDAFLNISKAFFVVLISLNIVWLVFLMPKFQKLRFVRWILYLLPLTIILIECLGYHNLATYLIQSIIQTSLLTALVVMTVIFIHRLSISNSRYAWAVSLRNLLHVKSSEAIKEFVFYKMTCYLIVGYIYCIALLYAWQVSPNIIDTVKLKVTQGFAISGMTIVPVDIVIALFSFGILLSIGRIIMVYIEKKYRVSEVDDDDDETQVALASLVSYAITITALIIALLIAGVNFTGLAIIAGALSVGIGLGLQSIVNNFVSGIILLMEKQLKPGDRILIGETEGFVKKVRLRSTQITTLGKSDVIIPNSELINQQVTNYMFNNKMWRVLCRVGVAYGSNVQLVEELLLKVANEHPAVIKTEKDKPGVLFEKFGESSLDFLLWCIVADVNRMYGVQSDLNYAIEREFRKHNISIAFPQRDLHIKSYVNMPAETAKTPKNS
ncbi:MAG: mechanosensitive ion channel [Gammaproteobacteria bacterium]